MIQSAEPSLLGKPGEAKMVAGFLGAFALGFVTLVQGAILSDALDTLRHKHLPLLTLALIAAAITAAVIGFFSCGWLHHRFEVFRRTLHYRGSFREYLDMHRFPGELDKRWMVAFFMTVLGIAASAPLLTMAAGFWIMHFSMYLNWWANQR